MMLFLEEFWNGNASPGERHYHSKYEYEKPLQSLERCEDYFKKHLDKDALRILEEYATAEREISCLASCDNFIDGFRIGVMMMLDVLLDGGRK